MDLQLESGRAPEPVSVPAVLERPRILPLLERARAHAATDPAHDLTHCMRVLANALHIAQFEGGEPELLAAAALLHDLGNLPKNHPEAKLSSERSAELARRILAEAGFSSREIERVADAILCHSYSRGLTPKTLEGRVFQDADRLDGLGAIGVARTFATGGSMGIALYHSDDPFMRTERGLDDKAQTVDHFYTKLFGLGDRMLTLTGFRLAKVRIERMRRFVAELQEEIHGSHRD